VNSNIEISTDKNKLDINKIHHYITNESYWGQGRTLKQVKQTIEQSICFALYKDNEQVAFARVVTDMVTFAYLLDVIVFPEYRKKGYSKRLMENIMSDESLKNVNWFLRTGDAHTLYNKYGFTLIDSAQNFMCKQSIK
jgi:N-acetylglutamate synthase-like GNAT family acetyltransferase